MVAWIVTLALVASEDPRIHLVRLQQAEQWQEALEVAQQLSDDDPTTARRLGIDYLRGHLLDKLGQREAASEAFAQTMASTKALAPWARLRIARDQELLGHPEVAAGLSATLLGANPPKTLVPGATSLLARTIARGGDCRLLSAGIGATFPAAERRQLELVRADCALLRGDADEAVGRLLRVLQEKPTDLAAFEAADRLRGIVPQPADPARIGLLGRAFHEHRVFDLSENYLGQLVLATQEAPRRVDFDLQYRWIRSHFWLGRFKVAAQHYGSLAQSVHSLRHTSQALYHQGRSLELAGDWVQASAAYRRAFQTQPDGNFAAASLISAMRIDWRRGIDDAALALFEELSRRPGDRYVLSRAALFLAASDIVQGRTDRAASWLQSAATSSRSALLEVSYWRGRSAEIEGNNLGAVTQYLATIRRDAFHPLSRDARRRLQAEALAPAREEHLRAISNLSGWDELHDAWTLASDRPQVEESARQRLLARLSRDPANEVFLTLRPTPVESWKLWTAAHNHPQEKLLALGIWDESAEVVSRHFPVAEPHLALAAAQQLHQAGRTQRSLLIAEILQTRIPSRIPEPLVATALREAIFPRAYWDLAEGEAREQNVDAHLLLAIMREESRFDPVAASNASARGLTQFVFPTAVRIGQRVGIKIKSPRVLEEPSIAISLGAGYLRELSDRFGGARHQMITAYNAGEPQAELWQRYCYTRDAAEYFSKVSFRETRNYLARVERSKGQYDDLYGAVSSR